MKVVQFKALLANAKETGKPVGTKLFWKTKDGEYYLKMDMGERPVTIVQTERFAMATTRSEAEGFKVVNSWGEIPKAKDLKGIADNIAEVTFSFGKLVYDFSALKG